MPSGVLLFESSTGRCSRSDQWTSVPCGTIPGVRNVLGTSPSPARVNFGNVLYHFPVGTSGLELSQSCNASKSAIEIRPSRNRSTRCFMKYGGGFLIFGILVLPVEHDLLKLFGQAAEFAVVLGLLDALQTEVQSLLRSVNGSGGRVSFIGLLAEPLPPSRLNGFPRAFATLFRSEFGGSSGTALLAALPPQGNGGWIFPLYVGGHI